MSVHKIWRATLAVICCAVAPIGPAQAQDADVPDRTPAAAATNEVLADKTGKTDKAGKPVDQESPSDAAKSAAQKPDAPVQKPDAPAQKNEQSDQPERHKRLFRGQVVRLREALAEQGIKAFSEFDDQVVLKTPDGTLIPIVPDWRGRAFFQDERLRDRDVELVAYQQSKAPYIQVLMMFTFDEQGQRQYTDYWCDICSIPMYEIKPCDCCQGDIRLRYQPQELPDYLNPTGEAGESKPAGKSKPEGAPDQK